MTTQRQVDKAIRYFLAEAEKYEAARDAVEYESAEYWDQHDSAMNLILAAEELMPQSMGGRVFAWPS